MNQRAKPHAAPGTLPPAPGRAELWRTELKGRREPTRVGAGCNSVSGAGEQARSHRRAAGPAPPPLLPALTLRAAATRRLTVPGPRRLLTLPSPPASAGLQLPLSRAAPTRAALKPAAASASTGRSQSAERPFPGQRRPREPSAAAELAAGGGARRNGAGRTGGKSGPSPCSREEAGGSRRRGPAAGRGGLGR